MNGAGEERLRLAVLGQLEVSVHGRPQTLTGVMRRAVLLRLLVAGGAAISPERLVDDIWGSPAPTNALATLRNSVSYLRRVLGPSAILTTPAGYVLVRPVGNGDGSGAGLAGNRLIVDADEFVAAVQLAAALRSRCQLLEAHDALVAALDLWRGTALVDAQNWSWSTAESSRLEELRSSAIDELITVRIELGLYSQAVAAADVAVASDPLRERRWELLMRALALAGRPVEATRAYDRFRTLLGEETGLVPSPNVAALHATIVAGKPLLQSNNAANSRRSNQPGGRSERSEGTSGAESGDAPGDAGPGLPTGFGAAAPWIVQASARHFVGRTEEVGRLALTVDALLAGRSRSVIVSGEPGVGKTALAALAAHRAAERGAFVVCAAADERSSGSFGPFVSMVEELLRQRPHLRDQLSAGAGEALQRSLDRAPVRGDVDAEQGARAHALRSLLEAAAREAPLVVVLDDLQWFDGASLALIRSLVDQRVAPLALICTLRDTEVAEAPAVGDFLAWTRRRSDDIDRLALGGLDADSSSELVGLVAGQSMTAHDAESLCAAVYDAAHGHPFFTIELARESVHRRSRSLVIPESVREVIERRLARLGDDITHLLQVASIIGLRFEFALLTRVLGRSDDDVLDDLDLAVRAGLVVEDQLQPGWFSFDHALVPESIRSTMLAVRRRRIHRNVAEALDAVAAVATPAEYRPPNESDEVAKLAERATHWIHGYSLGNVDEARLAIELARSASTELSSLLAARPALVLLDAAADVIAREAPGDRYLNLRNEIDRSVLLRAVGEPGGESVVALGLEAHALGFGDIVISAALSLWRGTLTWRRADSDNIALVEAALTYVPEDRHSIRARLLARLAAEHVSLADRELANELSHQALRAAQASGSESTRLEVILACLARAVPDAIRRDGEQLAEALRLAAGQPNLLTKWVTAREAGLFMLRSGDGRGMREAVREMARLDTEIDVPFTRWMTSLFHARVAALDGDLDKAEHLILTAQRVGLSVGQPDARIVTGPFMISLRWHQGRGDEQIAELETIAKIAPTSGTFAFLARVYVDHGRPEDALQLLRSAAERLDARQAFTLLAVESTWAYIAVRLERAGIELPPGTLDRLTTTLLPYRGCIAEAMPSMVGAVSHFLGMLAAAQHQDEEAARYFDEALVTHRQLAAPFFVSWTLVERSRARLASGTSYADVHADLEEALRASVRHRFAGLVRDIHELVARYR